MGREGGARKAHPQDRRTPEASRPGATGRRRAQTPPRTVFATVGILVLFVAAIGGLLAASLKHRTADVSDPLVAASVSIGTLPSPYVLRSSATPPAGTTSAPARPALAPSRRAKVVHGHRFSRVKRITITKPTTFRVASLNVLGASHTAGKAGRKGYASGPARMNGEVAILRGKGITVAGMQEFQPPQVAAFRAITGGEWAVWPGTASVDNSIVWMTSEWKLVSAETRTFPYFNGRPVEDPIVKLQNLDSGREIWFANFHTPADVHGMHNAGWRASSLTKEAELVKELGKDGTPVVLTGDMNDRQTFACPFTAQSGMHSSDGWQTVGGSCRSGTGYPNVDWIMGTHQIVFSDGVPDFVTEHQHLSDHPIITATATIAGGAASGATP